MTTKVVPGQLVAAPDAEGVAREAGARLARILKTAQGSSGRASIALSGGNTPREAYALLARQAGVRWPGVDVFWVDERAVAPTDARSNYRTARETLLEAAAIPAACIHRMPGEAVDLDAAARDYEATLRARVALDADGVPAIDLVVLGIGEDGHTASLFPGEPTVDEATRLVAAVPSKGKREARLTLTTPAIEHAKAVVILAVGAGKREALERVWALQGDLHRTPARILRACRGSVTWVIDQAAGLTE